MAKALTAVERYEQALAKHNRAFRPFRRLPMSAWRAEMYRRVANTRTKLVESVAALDDKEFKVLFKRSREHHVATIVLNGSTGPTAPAQRRAEPELPTLAAD